MQLLTTSNPKTQKGVKQGYLTSILHLAPSKLSGTNVCPDATPECIRFCLNKAGRGGIIKKGEHTNKIQEARKARTKLFFEDQLAFFNQLTEEIEAHVRKADRLNLFPAIRLNGTSDIAWEDELPFLFSYFPQVQFYDYTKSYTRMRRFLIGNWPHNNYHLTFSRSETNDEECTQILNTHGNVAVVFDSVPNHYRGYPVYDGDSSDLRFLDPRGHIIGLKAKGKLARYPSPFKVNTIKAHHA